MKKEDIPQLKCGIIMPISSSNGYTEEHWENVLNIIKSAIEKTKRFIAIPVWENVKSDIIHNTIITNILECDIIVCDISTTNPNVMYELGLRMTIKKPVVIIKDDATKVPFDTNIIRFEPYPKDLHYFKVGLFIEKLSKNINNTWEDYNKDPESFTQLVNLQDYKKYKIITDSEKENLTIQEAFNYLCELISNNTSTSNVSNLHSIDLRAATLEFKGEIDIIKTYMNDFNEKIHDFLQEPKEESDQSVNEELDELMEKFTVFSNALDTFIKTVEGVING